METKTSHPDLVAYCGLYCGECKAYVSGRCPGCRKNDKAKWCQVRSCAIAEVYATCADCVRHADPCGCGKYHSWISRVFGFVFRSNRAACIDRIRVVGQEEFAREMTQMGRHSLPR